jgi:hypothetical protein
LLEILRVALRYIAEDLNGATTGAPPEYSAKHFDEPLLQGKAASSQAVSVSRQTDTGCSSLRESRAVGGSRGKSPGLFVTTKLWPACTDGDENVPGQIQEHLRWTGDASVFQN